MDVVEGHLISAYIKFLFVILPTSQPVLQLDRQSYQIFFWLLKQLTHNTHSQHDFCSKVKIAEVKGELYRWTVQVNCTTVRVREVRPADDIGDNKVGRKELHLHSQHLRHVNINMEMTFWKKVKFSCETAKLKKARMLDKFEVIQSGLLMLFIRT